MKRYKQKLLAGYRRAFRIYPAESRFFLYFTALGCVGLVLQKDTLIAGLSYASFWLSFMVSLLCLWHDDLFNVPG